MKKPVVLCIMDGYGKNDSDYGNAIAMAKKPNLDKLMAEYPMTYIGASGLDVGLPDGQMGNSEVGHTNIGAAELYISRSQELQRHLRTAMLKKILLLRALWIMLRARLFTLSVLFHPVVFILIQSIFIIFFKWLKITV